jgi:hypothetical protein
VSSGSVPSVCTAHPPADIVHTAAWLAPEPTVLIPTTATAAGLPAVPLLIPWA